MTKALSIMMILWAVVGIIFSVGFLFAPGLVYAYFGVQNVPAPASYFLALLGNAYLAPSIFVIIAAWHPLKNTRWIQLAIVWSILDALLAFDFMIKGIMSFSQVGVFPIIFDSVSAIVFLALYPWRKAPTG